MEGLAFFVLKVLFAVSVLAIWIGAVLYVFGKETRHGKK